MTTPTFRRDDPRLDSRNPFTVGTFEYRMHETLAANKREIEEFQRSRADVESDPGGEEDLHPAEAARRKDEHTRANAWRPREDQHDELSVDEERIRQTQPDVWAQRQAEAEHPANAAKQRSERDRANAWRGKNR
jgi:hypothetical protein